MAHSAGPSVLSGFNDAFMTGCSITQNVQVSLDGGMMDRLTRRVTTSAFHNSKERFDPPKCHPRTREALQQRIFRWLRRQVDIDTLIMWIFGAAGSGKSAILQSVAERCDDLGIPLASFFFSNRHLPRSTSTSFIATLVYQIVVAIPDLREEVEAAFKKDPLLLNRSVEVQAKELIIKPIQRYLQQGGQIRPFLLLIDGLDECNDCQEARIIETVGHIVQTFSHCNVPIITLFASRPEPHIRHAFDNFDFDIALPRICRICLDTDYAADADIGLFMHEKFSEIRNNHPLRRRIPPTWPSETQIHDLLRRASGQFIYASIVISFVSSIRHPPQQRLDIVLGIKPPKLEMPFAQLDALYREIFMSIPADVRPHALTLCKLALALTGCELEHMAFLLEMDEEEVELLVLDLASILQLTRVKPYFVPKLTKPVVVLHASLRDYFQDPARSLEWCVEFDVFNNKMARRCLLILNGQFGACPRFNVKRPSWHVMEILAIDHIKRARVTPELVEDLQTLPFLHRREQQDLVVMNGPAIMVGFGLHYWLNEPPLNRVFPDTLRYAMEKNIDEALVFFLDSLGIEASKALALVSRHAHWPMLVSRFQGRKRWFRFGHHPIRLFLGLKLDNLQQKFSVFWVQGGAYRFDFFSDPSRSKHHFLDTEKLAYGAQFCLEFLKSWQIKSCPSWMKSWQRRSKTRPWFWRRRKPHSAFAKHVTISVHVDFYSVTRKFAYKLPKNRARREFIYHTDRAFYALTALPSLLEEIPVNDTIKLLAVKPQLQGLPWALFPCRSREAGKAIARYRTRERLHRGKEVEDIN